MKTAKNDKVKISPEIKFRQAFACRNFYLYPILGFIFFACFAGGCEEARPEAYASEFLQLLLDEDFGQAQQLVSSETRKYFPAVQHLLIKQGFEIQDEVLDGKSAVVRYRQKYDSQIRDLYMIKSGKHWMVELERNRPAVTAWLFLNYLDQGDFEKASELADEGTRFLLGMLEGTQEEGAEAPAGAGAPVIYDEQIDVNFASVRYKLPGKADTEVIDLEYVNGEWLVSMKKPGE